MMQVTARHTSNVKHRMIEALARVLNAGASSRELAMAIRYVSEIVEGEYPAWRRVLFGLPDTYAAWRWYFSHDVAVAALGGNEVVAVKVHPDEYLAHCKASQIRSDMTSFRNFAQLKSFASAV